MGWATLMLLMYCPHITDVTTGLERESGGGPYSVGILMFYWLIVVWSTRHAWRTQESNQNISCHPMVFEKGLEHAPKKRRKETVQRYTKVSDSTLHPVDGQLACHLDIVNYSHLPSQAEKTAPVL
eukprot:5095885-Ditylum_brightwellii.AAC.1